MKQAKERDGGEGYGAKITLRSIIIGLVLMPPSAYWLSLAEIKWGVVRATYTPIFVNVIVIVFLIALANFLIGKLKKKAYHQLSYSLSM